MRRRLLRALYQHFYRGKTNDLDIPVFFLPKHCTLWVVAIVVDIESYYSMLAVVNDKILVLF